jgi:hypothetical protein
MMLLDMNQAFEITIPDVKRYNYEDGTQQPAYHCHDQIIIIQPHHNVLDQGS